MSSPIESACCAEVGEQAHGIRLRLRHEQAHDLLAPDAAAGDPGVLEPVGVEADRHAGVEARARYSGQLSPRPRPSGQAGVSANGWYAAPSTIGGA